jgi:hypothetical protein
MRRMRYLPWIGLPDILRRRRVRAEFVPDAATPEAMGGALLAQLESPRQRTLIAERSKPFTWPCAVAAPSVPAGVLAELAEGRVATIARAQG